MGVIVFIFFQIFLATRRMPNEVKWSTYIKSAPKLTEEKWYSESHMHNGCDDRLTTPFSFDVHSTLQSMTK